jgi:hypothetical protein
MLPRTTIEPDDTRSPETPDPGNGNGVLRGSLLALLVFGMVGTLVELFLLGHTESVSQWIPIVLLAIGLLTAIALAMRPAPLTVRALQATMLAFVASGLAGLYLHYRGNAEFELEMRPALHGFELFRESLGGATPSLAPGTMVQFGLLGLIVTLIHPALHAKRRPASTGGKT